MPNLCMKDASDLSAVLKTGESFQHNIRKYRVIIECLNSTKRIDRLIQQARRH